ncbi:PIG3 family NAD(P)H quinone oxidoreductase [Corallococcus coralloides DSM 2259]|uniref:PIG3 family NAD(P)H quinone oxidoreductase n=1 Tax=Corallococcus coralloides (strain ATCC 25202 / DSM 2259 / NBRC 100086 / M2) TaxID=1144275 RepID=H8MKK3_CORCM|nr:NAD(P)H-quinone oxidoreductase [Corallococcus coralloides]AFE10065.1 PIG3 family NAD(P)H quinone oxidoreductase [Corallococcus coralloides DSM 2259]
MKVVHITKPGGPEVLAFDERPEPVPGPYDVQVRVRASALNRADLLQVRGAYPPPPDVPQDVPGLEYAGEVVAVGPRARKFQPGDRVMGLVGGGAWSEVITTHEREVLRMPKGLDFADAAALPEAYLTAYDALVLQADLRPGETVLVHAVASGVGSAAALLCKAMGVRVVGTGRSAEKLARASEWGVGHTVLCESNPPVFADAVLKATDGRGADVCLDLVGGAYLPESVKAMAPRGRLMQVGSVAGARAELDLGPVMRKRLTLKGTVLRSRPAEEKMLLTQVAERQLLPLFDSGALRAVVDAVLPMTELRSGLERMAGNGTVGKIVVRWD